MNISNNRSVFIERNNRIDLVLDYELNVKPLLGDKGLEVIAQRGSKKEITGWVIQEKITYKNRDQFKVPDKITSKPTALGKS